MQQELEIINACLPLTAEHKLFTLKIVQGRWLAIVEQEQELHSVEHTSITANDCFTKQKLNAEKRILLPGLVDAHMHLDKAFSLSAVGNQSGTLEEACENYAAHLPSFSYEELRQRILRAALQSIAYGTSIIRTHIDFHASLGEEVAFTGVLAALDVKKQLAPYVTMQIILLSLDYQQESSIAMIEAALQLGVDGIGGAPYLSSQPQQDIQTMFRIAQKYQCILDFHSDESDHPEAKTVLDVAEQAIKHGMKQQVTVGHLCSLASMPIAAAEPIVNTIAEAQLHAISLPGANLYLQGRCDDECVRRGITRIKTLLKHGVNVAIASDNIHDPFHPFGRGDLLQIALLAAYGAHMGTPKDLRTLLNMITINPAAIVDAKGYGIHVGNQADFVVMDATTVEELFMLVPDRRWVYRASQWLRASAHPFTWSNLDLKKAWQSITL